MQTFTYRPKNDMKSIFKTYWPVIVTVGMAIWFILRPSSVRFFRIITIPHPIPVIVLCLAAIGVVVYYVIVKMPRIKTDLLHSKPITIENGIVKYTKTKGGIPKEIVFNIADMEVANIDDDDDEFSITIAEEYITFYANYFDDDANYQEFKKLFGISNE